MIGYIEHHIVDHCNLKCAGCSHFSPLAPAWFEDIEDFKRDFTQLAELTGHYIPTIRIMGGEPLLHPQAFEFLKIARQIFPASEIQIVTNGILIPRFKEEMLEVCNSNKIRVCVSNYNLNMNLQEILRGFAYTRIDAKGYLYNIALDLTGKQNPNWAFEHCDIHVNKWYYFQRGRLYPCCICSNIRIFDQEFGTELTEWHEDEDQVGISIYTHSLQEIENFLNTPIPLCKYCDTVRRQHTYHPFSVSKGDINEWICQ